MKGLWLYLRCVVANWATLAGFLLFAVGLWAPMTKPAQGLAYVFGVALLYLTDLGFDTYKAYRRAEQHFKDNGRFDARYVQKMLNQSAYCTLVGFRLAQQDLRRNCQNKARLE